MKEITLEKEKLLKEYALRYCGINDVNLCSKGQCSCRLMAEVRALMNVVLPSDFEHLTIKNFDGQDNKNKKILSPRVARSAKEKVIKYCWGDMPVEKINNMSLSELTTNSIILDRIKNGVNIVIHGDSPRENIVDENNDRVGFRCSPIGRTFVASILTREAIMLRVKGYPNFLYDWIEFGSLLEVLIKDEYSTSNYESCDWLVVDNITEHLFKASPSAKSFSQSKYDAFFYSRLSQQLPTILVFKFNVDTRMHMIEDTYGTAISKIITKKDTFKIDLSER